MFYIHTFIHTRCATPGSKAQQLSGKNTPTRMLASHLLRASHSQNLNKKKEKPSPQRQRFTRIRKEDRRFRTGLKASVVHSPANNHTSSTGVSLVEYYALCLMPELISWPSPFAAPRSYRAKQLPQSRVSGSFQPLTGSTLNLDRFRP